MPADILESTFLSCRLASDVGNTMAALIQEPHEGAKCYVISSGPVGPSQSVEAALAPASSRTSLSQVGASTDDDQQYSALRVLVERSRLMNEMKDVPRFHSILIVEDDPRDNDSLASKLRGLFGHDTIIRQCLTLGTAMDAVSGEQPDLVFLDDRLGPIDRAEKTVPLLRKAQCVATIIVVRTDRRITATSSPVYVG